MVVCLSEQSVATDFSTVQSVPHVSPYHMDAMLIYIT